MFSKATTLFALFAAAAHFVVATPPACLIGAMSTQHDPSNIQNVCTSGAKTVEAYLCANCTSYSTEAWNAWTSQCKSVGVTISSSTCSNSTSSSSSTASATSAKSSAAYSSGMMYPTGASSGFATATIGPNGNGTLATSAASAPTAAQSGSGGASATSGSSSATSTPAVANAAAGVARLGMDVVGLIAVGAFGAMLL